MCQKIINLINLNAKSCPPASLDDISDNISIKGTGLSLPSLIYYFKGS